MAGKERLFEIREWIKEERREKGEENRKTEERVFDVSTLETLYGLSKKGIIKALGGPISTGKEAVVFHAIGEREEELAIKIYKLSTSNFKAMLDYIIGDKRFKNIKKDRWSIIFAWAHKERKNLKKAHDCGIRVPKPIACEKNVLVMKFIGEEGIAAPRLKEVPVEELNIDIEKPFSHIVSYMKMLYNDAKLVHADLSEFNILINFFSHSEAIERERQSCSKEKEPLSFERSFEPVIIDMGQSVLLDHPHAEEFLKRDVRNVASFFNKRGIDRSEEEIIEIVKRR